MKNQNYFLIVFVLLSGCISVSAQECNCLENYQSLSQLIRVNYPGFQDKTTGTKKQRFTAFSDSLYKQVLQQKDTYQCYLSLKALISYFKDPHLRIQINYNNATKDQLRSVFSTLPADLISTGKTALIQKKSIALEGLWEMKGQRNDYYRMRISKNAEGNFTGVLVDADSVFWFPGQVKMIVKEEKGDFYKVTYLVRDHTPVELMMNVDQDGLLSAGTNGVWQRVDNDMLPAKLDQLIRSKSRPALTMLNGSTAYLRIPSFDPVVRDTLASILESNSKLMQSKNLVIDLRDNSGGSILVSNLLLKYLYDGPITTEGNSFLTSAQNIRDFETRFKQPELAPFYTDGLRAMVEELKKQPDSLVSFSEKVVTTLDSVYPAPQKVYILINKVSASASEFFVLQAKQSKKVKIIGQNTKGAIDYLNVGLPRMLPCQLFYLENPLTRSDRLNNIKLDDTGIAPDILLPNDEDALLFVKTKLIKE